MSWVQEMILMTKRSQKIGKSLLWVLSIWILLGATFALYESVPKQITWMIEEPFSLKTFILMLAFDLPSIVAFVASIIFIRKKLLGGTKPSRNLD